MSQASEGLTFTVCICTRNRVGYLVSAIESVLVQILPRGRFDVLVVDNGSSDGTSEMVRARFGPGAAVPVRCIRDEAGILSRARNRAIAETTSDVVIYMDDDAVPEPGWLAALADVFASSPDVAIVGGGVVPVYEGGRPAWLTAEGERIFSPRIAGAGRRRIYYPDYPYGANLAFRRAVFDRIGLFREDLGYVRSKLIPCDETELLLRAEKSGMEIHFEPRAVVRHLIPRNRLTRRYLRRRFIAAGKGCHEVERVRQGEDGVWGWRDVARRLGLASWGCVVSMARVGMARRIGGGEGFDREMKGCQDLGWHRASIQEVWEQLWKRIRAGG